MTMEELDKVLMERPYLIEHITKENLQKYIQFLWEKDGNNRGLVNDDNEINVIGHYHSHSYL